MKMTKYTCKSNGIKIDPWQNDTAGGYRFGYAFCGDGGYFFTWRYDPKASYRDRVNQVIDTIEADEIDPPTQFDVSAVATALRALIRDHGFEPVP